MTSRKSIPNTSSRIRGGFKIFLVAPLVPQGMFVRHLSHLSDTVLDEYAEEAE